MTALPVPAGVLEQRPADTATTADGLDATISAATAARIEAATAAHTRRAYTRQWTQFTAWCTRAGRSAMPCSDATLAEYASALADADAGTATIEQAISTIRRRHRDAGQAGPDTRGARLVLRTHRRDRAAAGARTRQA
uniref:site-specific integrase n=1 Tax=Frankia sp. CiP3 TaxID=2880971 RepID=UPI001EF6F493